LLAFRSSAAIEPASGFPFRSLTPASPVKAALGASAPFNRIERIGRRNAPGGHVFIKLSDLF